MAILSKTVIDHCDKHKNCKDCPFVGARCTAPVSDHLFDEWIKNLTQEISKHYAIAPAVLGKGERV